MQKKCLAVVLILCFLICGCKNKNPLPDNEANVTVSGAFKDTSVNFVDPKDIDVSEITPAEITAQEEKELWCYKTLNETQKRYYKIMLTMVRNLSEGFVNFGYGSKNFSSDIAVAYRALMNDFPEYYWMPESYYISADEGVISVAFKKSSLENGYGFERFEVQSNAEEFLDAVDLLTQRAQEGKDTYEKVKILHDELCKRTTYSEDTTDITVYSSYGALVNGKALCEGYARAFQLLCKNLSIECLLVSGTSKGVGHLWNLVKTEDGWFHIDVTWDDLRNEPLYTYLNLTRRQILIDHDIDIDFKDASLSIIAQGHSFNFNLPEESKVENDYFTKNNLLFAHNDAQNIAKHITNRYKEGYFSAQIAFLNEDEAESFKENYETVVVEVQKRINDTIGSSKIKLKTISFSRDTCVFYYEKVKK